MSQSLRHEIRLINTSGNHYKEYQLELHQRDNGAFEVLARWGRINGGRRSVDVKYVGNSYQAAMACMTQWRTDKIYSGYSLDFDRPFTDYDGPTIPIVPPVRPKPPKSKKRKGPIVEEALVEEHEVRRLTFL